MLSIRPEKSDSVFTWTDFASKNNNELLTNIGNLCNRVFKFLDAKYSKVKYTKIK
jgi:methionyl-tRNA synthetase